MTSAESYTDCNNRLWLVESNDSINIFKNQNVEFKNIFIERLLRGFKFSKNGKGIEASDFLGKDRQYFNIKLPKYGMHNFLVAE